MPDKKILFCTDFSDNALRAFKLALLQAQFIPGCRLFLLHVIPAPDAHFWKPYIYNGCSEADDNAKKALDQQIAQTYLPLMPEGLTLEPVFRIGKPNVEILRFADEIQADMIVIGRQGRDALDSLLYGKEAEKIVTKTKCPVLVVPL